MKTFCIAIVMSLGLLAGCRHSGPPSLRPSAYGTQIVEVSGGKQMAQVGVTLPQPLVLQVNGGDGNPVTGALLRFHGDGLRFSPAEALTDASGQAAVTVRLGFAPGDYQITAETPKSGGGSATMNLREIALGYEQTWGQAINDQYCIRCHDSESTPERVSNFDNLSPQPHQFTDGNTMNRIADADLINIITHGSQAAGKSPQSPAYGATLKPTEIRAVVSFIRAVADPPYQPSGVKYGK